jgi:hypothetical protein
VALSPDRAASLDRKSPDTRGAVDGSVETSVSDSGIVRDHHQSVTDTLTVLASTLGSGTTSPRWTKPSM